MKKLALFLAILATPPLACNLEAQTAVDPTQNGYISLQQSNKGTDVLPSPVAGVDTLVYAAGALSLVHDTNAAVPVATTASTVASATSLAATPTACPAGQALNAIDAKGNAVTCVPVVTSAASNDTGSNTGAVTGAANAYTYTQPSIQPGDTLTGSQTVYASQANIPVGVLGAGSVIEVDASGTYDINAAQESGAGMIWLRIGGARVAAGNFRTNIGVGNNYVWMAHFKAIIRTVGAAGTMDPLLEVKSSTNPYGGIVELASFNATAAVDTVAANAVQIEFVPASTTDSATLRQMTVTVH